jgi:hypothetical protein
MRDCINHARYAAGYPPNETWGSDTVYNVPYAPGVKLGNVTRPSLTACGSLCAPKVRTEQGCQGSLWPDQAAGQCTCTSCQRLVPAPTLLQHHVHVYYIG